MALALQTQFFSLAEESLIFFKYDYFKVSEFFLLNFR